MGAILFVGGLLITAICVGPALMALIALVQIQRLKNEVASLSDELYALRSGQREAPQLNPRQGPTPAPMSFGRAPQPSPQLSPEPSPSAAQLPAQTLAMTSADQAGALDAVTAPLKALTPESPQAPPVESAPAMSAAPPEPQIHEADETPQVMSPARPEPAPEPAPTPQAAQARTPEHAPPADAARPSAKDLAPEDALDAPDEEESPDLFRLFNELDWGGKLTGFIGIGLLLIGVAFMVGYAVNQG